MIKVFAALALLTCSFKSYASSFVDLTPSSLTPGYATGINNSTWISAYQTGSSGYVPLVFKPNGGGTYTQITLPLPTSATGAMAQCISNASGSVMYIGGFANYPTDGTDTIRKNRPVYWDTSDGGSTWGAHVLSATGTNLAYSWNSINVTPHGFGYQCNPTVSSSFLPTEWSTSGALGTTTYSTADFNQGMGINASDICVGTGYDPSTGNHVGFIGSTAVNTTSFDVVLDAISDSFSGTIGGTPGTYAFAVGSYNSVASAWTYSTGARTSVGTISGGSTSIAKAINASHNIVGTGSNSTSGNAHGFIAYYSTSTPSWGTPGDLNAIFSFGPDDSGLWADEIVDATGINSSNVICGTVKQGWLRLVGHAIITTVVDHPCVVVP